MKSYILCFSIFLVLISSNGLAHDEFLDAEDLLNDNLQPRIGVMSEEVAAQLVLTYGVGKISEAKQVGDTYQIKTLVDDVQTNIEIDRLGGIVRDKTTQLTLRPPFTDYDRVMNWGEAIVAPDLLPTMDKQVFDYPPYKVRYYPVSNTYLGYNTEDKWMYIYSPKLFGDEIKPLAPLSSFLPSVHQEGF